MTRAEQEAFEKWKRDLFRNNILIMKFGLVNEDAHKRAFLAGYRAGFEAQYYEVGDAEI